MKKVFLITMLLILIVTIRMSYKKTISSTLNSKLKYDSNNELKILEKFDYVDGYKCNKVKVLDENNRFLGSYNLEDYVAGVVSGETHILNDETTFKAMSVAIRTYTLYVTNDCKNYIVSSEAAQVMNRQNLVSEKIRKAVNETKGQILTYKGKVINSEYDSFYKGNGFYCDRKFCYSNYLKVGTEKPKSHKIKVPATWSGDLAGGHGNGLSQYGAKYLSENGSNYVDILKYFYADEVKISTLIKPDIKGLSLENDNYISRISRPSRNNKFYYTNGNVSNELEGESTWYTTSRANEILKSRDINNKINYPKTTDDYCNNKDLKVELDYSKPKKGSIISWGKHSAIIENVYDDSVDITESYIGLGYYGIEFSYEYLNEQGKFYNKKTNQNDRKENCEKNNSGCFKRTNNIKISDLENRWGYKFRCYVYLEK